MENKKKKSKKSKVKKRYYSDDFKQEAVRLSKTKSVREVASELGIAQPTLSKWRKEILNPKAKPNSKAPSYEELLRQVKKLKKEKEYLSDIAEVLKKSTAIFSKDHLDGSE